MGSCNLKDMVTSWFSHGLESERSARVSGLGFNNFKFLITSQQCYSRGLCLKRGSERQNPDTSAYACRSKRWLSEDSHAAASNCFFLNPNGWCLHGIILLHLWAEYSTLTVLNPNVYSVMQRLDSPIHWIEIDPLDSVIQPLNTRSGICHAFEMWDVLIF